MNERPFDSEKADRILQNIVYRIGSAEKPLGSNRGPLVDKALRFVGIDPTKGTPNERQWCAALACLVVHDAGITDGPRTASTGAIYAWAKQHGALVSVPRRGDIGCLRDATSPTGFRHTVILEHNFGDDIAHTAAGNEDNRVQRNTYPISAFEWVRPYHP